MLSLSVCELHFCLAFYILKYRPGRVYREVRTAIEMKDGDKKAEKRNRGKPEDFSRMSWGFLDFVIR